MSDFKITCAIAKAYERQENGVRRRLIGGLASGTGTDLDGERMAESAIDAFRKAIKDGMTLPDGQWSYIPLRSGHRNEWDDVLGWIVDAEIDKDHNLWIEAEIDQENPVADSLFRKLTKPAEHGKPLKLGLSVGGSVLKAGYEWNDDLNEFTKTYYDVQLREVSVVSQPAYPTSYLVALNKSVNWDALRPETQEALVKAQVEEGESAVPEVPSDELIDAASAALEQENTMEEEMTKNEEMDVVAEEMTKAAEETAEETPAEEVVEAEADVVEEESKMTLIETAVAKLTDQVATIAQSVEALAAQLSEVTAAATAKSADPVADEQPTVEKSTEASVASTELIKQAVLAAIEPVMERLEKLENEPIDKSYAVIKNKYSDETFDQRVQREISEVDGRAAVRRALELAMNS